MKKAVLYNILCLAGMHLVARGLVLMNVSAAHFILITLLGTTLMLPVGFFYIFDKNLKEKTISQSFIKVTILLLLVYTSFLLDNKFNEHTDQVGRDLGKLSLAAGFAMVIFLISGRHIWNIMKIKKKNGIQQSIL